MLYYFTKCIFVSIQDMLLFPIYNIRLMTLGRSDHILYHDIFLNQTFMRLRDRPANIAKEYITNITPSVYLDNSNLILYLTFPFEFQKVSILEPLFVYNL